MPARRSSIWIISPVADLVLLIATPLAIVPIVSLLAKYRLSPEEIAISVFAFASLGHHLPGFLRAYGDRDLFRRFRYRFLLAPPLALAASWISFVSLRLHGLELLLLFWATWHILMQTYGFMRIYDLKRGAVHARNARLDFWACVAVFAAGVVFSDARVFGIVETFWLTGLPLFEPEWLTATRWLVGTGTGVVLAALLVRTLQSWRESSGVGWLKLLLLISTAVLYWGSGQLSVNLLVGVAMFEVFHAIQYYAIVWSYGRRQSQRNAGKRSGLMARLFGGQGRGVLVYMAMILAFGSLGFVAKTGDSSTATRVAMALFSASAMLHFYYDGFIWKVSEPKTGENLQLARTSPARPTSPSQKHALYWAVATALLVGLLLLEHSRPPTTDALEQQRLKALAQLTPELPELQLRKSQSALLHGDAQVALAAAQKAVANRARSYSAQLALGRAAAQLAQWKMAQRSFTRATQLRPESGEAWLGLGTTFVQSGDFSAASAALQRCLEISGDHAQANFQLGNAYYFSHKLKQAIKHYRRSAKSQPTFAAAHTNLGTALLDTNQLAEAATAYRQTVRLTPNSAAAHYNLGLALLRQGETISARSQMLKAEQLGQPLSSEIAAALGL